MGTDDSLIKARYARTIFRIARNSRKPEALKFLEGLAHETPTADTPFEIATAHLAFTAEVTALAVALREPVNVGTHWDRAETALHKRYTLLE
jgi:hypothetical protein